MSHFLNALRSGRVLLMDGAMGTELQRAGIRDGECYEYWNLEHPEKVRAIHQSYVDAGARVLAANTFQANPRSLQRFGLAHDLEKISEAGVALARAVAGPDRFVLASVGPFPDDLSVNDIQRTVSSLASADGLLLETASTLCNLFMIQTHAPAAIPILLSLTFQRANDGSVALHDPGEFERILGVSHLIQVAALGVNCGRDVGLDEILAVVRRFRSATALPVFVRPNAGTPTRRDDRWVYPLTPQMLADRLPELLAAGVRMIGGCCGTTAEHIAALRAPLDTI